ncbi:hypothetical protein [Streptomyces syringium]|uniref:Uncharacterized protein n=1 Tax=Streptomyces syringium TaxID=76729 RepID=A0ABS4Y5K7_9ACTN|nr:hypothetical protein [Streptomyces syringium]MBP2404065.1 hypothetical protein [Streptomyces syringium]
MNDRHDPQVVITAVRHDPGAAPGQTTVIRVLSMLPAHWVCTPVADQDGFELRVRLQGAAEAEEAEAVRACVARVFEDPALRGWRRTG